MRTLHPLLVAWTIVGGIGLSWAIMLIADRYYAARSTEVRFLGSRILAFGVGVSLIALIAGATR